MLLFIYLFQIYITLIEFYKNIC